MGSKKLIIHTYKGLTQISDNQLILSQIVDVAKTIETGLRISIDQEKKHLGNTLLKSIFDEQFYTDHTPFFDTLCYLDAFFYYDMYRTYRENYELEFNQEFSIFSDYILERYGVELLFNKSNNQICESIKHKEPVKISCKLLYKLFSFLLQIIDIKKTTASSLLVYSDNRYSDISRDLLGNLSKNDTVIPFPGLSAISIRKRWETSSVFLAFMLALKLPFVFVHCILQLHYSMHLMKRDALLLAVYRYRRESFSTKILYFKCMEASLLRLATAQIRKNIHIRNIYFIGYLELVNKALSLSLKRTHRTALIRYNDTACSLERVTLKYQFDEVLAQCEQSKQLLLPFIQSVWVSPVASLDSDIALQFNPKSSSSVCSGLSVLILDESIPTISLEKKMRLRFLSELEHLSDQLGDQVNFTLRPHPTTKNMNSFCSISKTSLEEDLQNNAIVIGRNSTLLLRASRHGHNVIVYDPCMGKFLIQNKNFYQENIVWISKFEVLVDLITQNIRMLD